MGSKNNVCLIAIIVILVIALLGLSFYLAYDKGLIFDKNGEELPTEENINEDNNDEKEEVCNEPSYVSLEIKDDNCINPRNNTYQLYSGDGGVSVFISDDNTVRLQISRSANLALINKDEYQLFTIKNFTQKIVDVLVGTIGQDIIDTTIIILMEDGSVEYIPLYKALQTGNVQSYGKLEGIAEIIKLYSAVAHIESAPTGGGMTILAQKADGTYYDLKAILENTGNY